MMPEDLKARPDDTYLRTVWNGQISQFESRRAAIEGQRSVIREKINQLGAQIVGGEAQVKAFTGQITSVQAEAENITPLVEQGLIARPRSCSLSAPRSASRARSPTPPPTSPRRARRSPSRSSRSRSSTTTA